VLEFGSRVHDQIHTKEWATKNYQYVPTRDVAIGIHLVQPYLEKNQDNLQMTEKDHPTEPALFKTDHTAAKIDAFFNTIKKHGRGAGRNRWGNFDPNAVEGPFADWDKLQKSLIFTKEGALTYLGECPAGCNPNSDPNTNPNHDNKSNPNNAR
jgi:hypothetical protein